MKEVYIVQLNNEPLYAFKSEKEALGYLDSIKAIRKNQGDTFHKGADTYIIFLIDFNPPPITKPSPYIDFMRTEVPRVKGHNPGISHQEAFKLAAERWQGSRRMKTN